MTHSFDAVPSNSAEEEFANRTELDFFLPVIVIIDAASSYIDRRVNVEYVFVSFEAHLVADGQR